MLPTRHSYGALSLEQGLVEQAATAYAEDLGLSDELVRLHQHPNNVWALHGYHECLTRLGRPAEAGLLVSDTALLPLVHLSIQFPNAIFVLAKTCACWTLRRSRRELTTVSRSVEQQ